MKIAIIGAGAMGCLYGSYLSKNNDLTMVDVSKACVNTINEKGICIEEKGDILYFPAKAVLSGDLDEKMDLVIVFVKAMYTDQALDANRQLLDENTILVSLQNGAGNDRTLAKYADLGQIVIGNSEHSSVFMGPGVTRHAGSGITRVGSLGGHKSRAEKVSKLFNASGIETARIENIQEIIWRKLMVNLAFNPLTTILNSSIKGVKENEHSWLLLKLLIQEALIVAEADGTKLDHQEVFDEIDVIVEKAGNGFTSMYQDIANGRKTEIDNINGAIVNQAALYDIDVPYNRMMTRLIKAIELQCL